MPAEPPMPAEPNVATPGWERITRRDATMGVVLK
jgi:hypothetical protein